MSPTVRRPKAILPWWQLALVLVVCGLGVWFLLPDDSQLIADLLRDGKPKEARHLLEKLSASERARDPARFRYLTVRTSRLELSPTDPAALDRFWREATAAWRETDFSGPIFLAFAPLVPRFTDPAAAYALIAADLPRAPATQRTRLTDDFIKAALAHSQPATAAEIFSVAHPDTARPPADSLELSRLWQLAARPVESLAALGDGSAPALVVRRTALLRALNRNREALALLRARADSTAPDAALTDELATVALAAGEPAAAAPYVQRYLETQPRDLAAHRRLRTLLLSAGQTATALAPAQTAVTLGSRAPDDLRELARIFEYSAQPSAAFDTWLELALSPPSSLSSTSLTSSTVALDRLLALNPGLYRDADIVRALAKLTPVPDRPEYTLRLARLQVSLGLFDLARSSFDTYLAAAPNDADALIDYAHLHRELYRFADAEALLRRAAALRPTALALRREIAETLVSQNRHTDALALYRQLAQESQDEEIIGPYTRLAESLGRYDDFTRGLRRRIDSSPTPAARDFILLAYSYELADDPVRRQAALDEGLRRAEQSDDLRLQLALALSAQKKYTAAQAALSSHAALHAAAPAATLYLELLRLNNDTAAERLYLAEPLAPALAHDEAILVRVARTRESLRDYPEAERLWRELIALRPAEFDYTASLARVLLLRNRAAEAHRLLAPFLREPAPAVLRLAAAIAEAAGDHRSAENHQLAYLEAVGNAPAADWGALGDIRLARGDRTGAKRAYAQALLRLHTQISAKGGPP